MKDIKRTLCTACKIYYEDIDYDNCPLCDLKGDDDAWRRTYERTHADLLAAEKEIAILRENNKKISYQNTDLMNAIDDIAMRQREACALAVERKSEKDTAYYACMLTPLVSEE